jgi:hypothetical protein
MNKREQQIATHLLSGSRAMAAPEKHLPIAECVIQSINLRARSITVAHNISAYNEGEYITDQEIIDVKPILRPLSQLKEYIVHEREPFIPMIEIGNLMFPGHKHLDSNKIGFEEGDAIYISLTYQLEFDPSKQCFFHQVYSDTGDNLYNDSNIGSLKMYQKLFEWDFDVFGLIESGLAIDMNTFNNQNK